MLNITREERDRLKALAAQVDALIDPEADAAKIAFWKRHNTLRGERPAVFISPDNAWGELVPASSRLCRDPFARELEYQLLQRIARHRYLPDDVPLTRVVKIPKVIRNTMWGVEPKREYFGGDGSSWHHIPIIEKASDWKQLSMPEVSFDEAATREQFDFARELFEPALEVRSVGRAGFSFHLIHSYCDYRGMDNLYLDLLDEPAMVHDVMRFFTEGFKSMIRQYEAQNLMELNNDDTYHYTGGIGYNDLELPSPDYKPGRVRRCDLWAAAEAQEFCNVSPEMHEEFALSYERELLDGFGLNGYGCCDDLGKKLDSVLKISNLRRVAICPWADIDDFRPVLGDRYIMTWKPQPSHLAHDRMNSAAIENELRAGLVKARGGRLELILRDTNTCRGELSRFAAWVQIARRAIAELWE
ncbi:MAG: hypothetical protein AB7F32_06665 [Victivallaceae bacterium]